MILDNFKNYMFFKTPAGDEGGNDSSAESSEEQKPKPEEENLDPKAEDRAADDSAQEQEKAEIADLLDIVTEKDDAKGKQEAEEAEAAKGEPDDETQPETVEESDADETVEGEQEEESTDEEVDPLLAEIGRLTQTIADLERGTTPPTKETKEEGKKEEAPKAKEEPKTPAIPEGEDGIREYITKDMFKDTFGDEERTEMNKVLTKFRNEIYNEVRNTAIQDGMDIFPQMINYRLQGYIAAQEFWGANPDLKAFVEANSKINAKQFVLNKATEIQKANPEWSLGQVYKQTEQEVRTLLGNRLDKYKAQGTDPNGSSGKRPPALPRKPGGSRKTAPARTPRKLAEGEAAAFNDLLDNEF